MNDKRSLIPRKNTQPKSRRALSDIIIDVDAHEPGRYVHESSTFSASSSTVKNAISAAIALFVIAFIVVLIAPKKEKVEPIPQVNYGVVAPATPQANNKPSRPLTFLERTNKSIQDLPNQVQFSTPPGQWVVVEPPPNAPAQPSAPQRAPEPKPWPSN